MEIPRFEHEIRSAWLRGNVYAAKFWTFTGQTLSAKMSARPHDPLISIANTLQDFYSGFNVEKLLQLFVSKRGIWT